MASSAPSAAIRPTTIRPILVLSTEAEQGSKDIANEAGANGWIVKPFDPDGLVKLVSTFCE